MSSYIFDTIYGLASTGKYKVWSASVTNVPEGAILTVTHGSEGGKQTTTSRTIREGKNLGKSNETAPYQQALLEATALRQKKLDKGYRTTKAELVADHEATNRLPMLAHKYTDRQHTLVWPAFVQPKLNGIRCLIERVGDTIQFYSRGNKQFTTLGHLTAHCLRVMRPGDIFDGELYNHGDITFQELCSLVKDTSPTEEKRQRCAAMIQFWNYDRCILEPFSVRRTLLLPTEGPVRSVPTYAVESHADVVRYHAQFVADGYEGTMIRSGGDEPYRFQYRSPSLLKYKDFVDEEFTIIDVKEGDGKAVGQAIFVCRVGTSQTVNVRCKGTDGSRREQWGNRAQYIGKRLTVRFQNYSDDGIPVFPVGVAIRDYE